MLVAAGGIIFHDGLVLSLITYTKLVERLRS